MTAENRVAVVIPTRSATTRLRPLSAADVTLTGGFWAERARINRARTIPHGYAQLERAGNFHDLELAAGAAGRYEALGMMFDTVFPFLDSDVYKWLEAVGWELGRAPDPELHAFGDRAIDLVRRAQRPDGYINSFVQVLAPGKKYEDLRWGHELYCIGHLIQAGVAWHRAVGDDRLLEIATRAADSVDRELGPQGRVVVDGHPEIEMALVELYRVTAERRYLDLAATFIERRGHGLLGDDRFGSAYWQDHAPVREAATVAGHAVRQLYLDCGAVDVAVEFGDSTLLDAVRRRWQDMVATRTYLTGGVGSRHRDEAFGDPFELPPDRAYTESCAAIASVMLSWRLLLASGDAVYADLIERTMFNGVLAGLGLEGDSFFYVNPLQRRTRRVPADRDPDERQSWYPCACCPPNLMRTISSWQQMLATRDEEGVQVHQYAAAELRAEVGGSELRLAIDTHYPWDGRVTVDILESPDRPWRLTLRRPAWASEATVAWPQDAGGGGGAGQAGSREGSGLPDEAFTRTTVWRTGDRVVLDLGVTPRVTEADARIDAVRGCVALERGPLVYCVESVDLREAVEVEDIAVDPSRGVVERARSEVSESVVGLLAQGVHRRPGEAGWPYLPSTSAEAVDVGEPSEDAAEVEAVPYFAWANRGPGGMRVWIPRVAGKGNSSARH